MSERKLMTTSEKDAIDMLKYGNVLAAYHAEVETSLDVFEAAITVAFENYEKNSDNPISLDVREKALHKASDICYADMANARKKLARFEFSRSLKM